ncbi:MAG: hypothetical protein RL328_2406 [Acidobacteriota bacterium]
MSFWVKSLRLRGLFALWCLPLGVVAHAQQRLTVTEAVREALEMHPVLAVQTQRIQSVAGQVQQAGLRLNPRLFIQSDNWNVGNANIPIASTFTDQFFYASQVLERGEKRQRRVDLAQQNVLLSRDERDILSRQIAARVKLAYWAAAGAQRSVELLKQSQEYMQQTIEYHEIQLREGAIAEGDVVRVRLEGDRTNVALENAQREAMLTLAVLQREMGREAPADVILVDSIDLQPAPPAVDIGQALEARPDLHQARQAVEQARANVRLQQANAKPDVEVLGGYKRTVGFNTFMWGVQVPLPFFNKNQGNIATAQSDVAAAEAHVRAMEVQIKAEIEAARRDVEARRQRLTSLVEGALARAEESLTIARAAYREGGTDLLRLLESERIYIELQIMNAKMRMEYRQSLVTLETTLGVSQ